MAIKTLITKPVTVLGIDPSTSGTGLVLLQENGSQPPTVLHEREVTPGEQKGCLRLTTIATAIMETIHTLKPGKIVMEGYSLNLKNRTSIIPLVELGGVIRLMFYMDGLKSVRASCFQG